MNGLIPFLSDGLLFVAANLKRGAAVFCSLLLHFLIQLLYKHKFHLARHATPELDTDWIHPWLDWIGSGF